MEEAGFVTFGYAGTGFAYLMANRPLATLNDLTGQKVWIPEGDAISFAALKALGVAPITMPLTDVMTGLQTDLIDSVTAPPVGAVVLQWHTRLKYITEVPVAYVYAALLIDKRAFGRLSDDDQSVFRDVMERVYDAFDENGNSDNLAALQALKDGGMEGVSTDPEELAAWRKIVLASHREVAKRGVFDEALLDRLEALLAAYREGGSAPEGGSR
jgi:TRAP-type C4-dicarboxylate transport system substrate-binding protein